MYLSICKQLVQSTADGICPWLDSPELEKQLCVRSTEYEYLTLYIDGSLYVRPKLLGPEKEPITKSPDRGADGG